MHSPATNIESPQCAGLSDVLSDKVSYASGAAYNSSLSSYWSAQEASLSPSCIVSPTSAEDVSTVIKTLYKQILAGQKRVFAIRGGGHTPWAGSANIDAGVTIDMRAINSVTVSDDRSIAYVGAGAVWGDVYRKTDSLGLAVVGGRGASIGVGGLTTAGGISYFSARKGFACDNVVNYEIVLADGTRTSANEKQNPDLSLALKGGSNNFGVVTRFDLRAFPSGNFRGGNIVYTDAASPALLKAFADLDRPTGYDQNAALILSFSSVIGYGEFASANIEYTQPTPDPPTFRPFAAAQPQLANTLRISNQTDFVTEFVAQQPAGRRQAYVTSTFRNDLPLLREAYALAKAAARTLPQTPGLTLSLVVQPVPPATTGRAAERRGNALGLDPRDGALVLCLLALTWDSPADDARVERVACRLDADIVRLAKARGLWNGWVYLNYAAEWQDPIGGYGLQNKAKLRAASRNYDPRGVFQKNVPGGFKLFA